MRRMKMRVAAAMVTGCLIWTGCVSTPDAAEVLEYRESAATHEEPTASPETTAEASGEVPPQTSAPSETSIRSTESGKLSSTPPPHTSSKTVLMLDVPYLSQKGILPNGCEAVSAVMLLHHLGDSIAPLDFVDRYLDCEPTWKDGDTRYGPDPAKAYAGTPKTNGAAIGCFFPVIVRALNRALEEYAPAQYQAASLTGLPLRELETYIDRGIPVAVWATIGMVEVPFYYEWISPEDGKTYRYPAREHCLVLVGYDDDRYYFNDPYNSNGLVSYHKTTVEKRYETLGRQAVAILPRTSSTSPTDDLAHSQSWTLA